MKPSEHDMKIADDIYFLHQFSIKQRGITSIKDDIAQAIAEAREEGKIKSIYKINQAIEIAIKKCGMYWTSNQQRLNFYDEVEKAIGQ